MKEIEIQNNINDYMTKKKKIKGYGVFNSIKNFFDPYTGYRPIVKKIIKEYGNQKIYKIQAFRRPIVSALDKVLNFISLGQFQKGKELSNYDKLYHLGLIITVGAGGKFTNILIEKNERITAEIVPLGYTDKTAEFINIPITKNITFGELLENAQKGMGPKYFEYDPFFGNNCQVYAKSLLEYSGLLTPEADSFIFQPLDTIIQQIPKSTPIIARAVTQLGAFFANIGSKITGKGDGYALHCVVVKKPITKDKLNLIKQEFIKGNKKFIRETPKSYRLRNIPKQKFIKDSFRSEKIKGKPITLIFGKLKETGGKIEKGVISEGIKKNIPKLEKEAYDFLSSIPKPQDFDKPVIIPKNKEDVKKLRKEWEEKNKDEMHKIINFSKEQKEAYKAQKLKEYNDWKNKPDIKEKLKSIEEAKNKTTLKNVEKAKKYFEFTKLINALKDRIKETKNLEDKDLKNKLLNQYNNDIKKVEEYKFWEVENPLLRDQLDSQYNKMFANMAKNPKVFGSLPSGKFLKTDPKIVEYVYNHYLKPNFDWDGLINDALPSLLNEGLKYIPAVGQIFAPIGDKIIEESNKNQKIPDIKEGDFNVGEIDYSKGYESIPEKDKIQLKEERENMEKKQKEIEQQQKEIVGSGKDKDFRELLKELGITQKKYLELMTIIAKKNGYDQPLKISKDKKHKLEYDGVKFGNSNYLDYILYWLTEGDRVARIHRDNYLKRTEKMKGEWKNNKLSPNNLSRIIIWDENNILNKNNI